MGWFGEDIFKAITRQFDRDKEKKARQSAAARANPDVARRISQYRAKYPHLTAGAALAPAQAGLDVNDPAVERIAQKAAKRRVQKGKGWFSIGQVSDILNIDETMDFIGKSLGVANDALQAGVRTAVVTAQSGPEALAGAYRRQVRDKRNNPIEVLGDMMTKGIFPKEVIEDTTIGIAIDRLKNPEEARRADLTLNPQDPSPGGSGIGQGYLPRGPAVEEQARRARETAFIEYADQPIFSALGKREDQSSRHALTIGRGAVKDVLEPGTLPFNLLSGIIDAGVSIVADPASAAGKTLGGIRQARRLFTAEEAGRTVGHAERVAEAAAGAAKPLPKSPIQTATDLFTSANEDPELVGKSLKQINEILTARRPALEEEMGMIRSHRNTIHPPTTQNWLTVSAPGRKFTQWVADTDDPYTIYKTLNAEKNNIPVALINNMAATTNTDEALSVLSSELGVGLSTKPITSRFQPVGGYLGEVKNSLLSNRILNAMPHQAAHIADPDTSAAQLVRLMRGADLPEEKIGPRFNEFAAAATKEERASIFNSTEADIYEHILEDITGPLTVRAKDTRKRLNGLWANNTEVLNTVLRRQIAAKTAPESLDVGGVPAPIRNIYEEAEYLDDMYQLPDARAMRRLTSQYGRLLNHPVLEVPTAMIDHLSSVWKTFAIARPALTLRVVGEEQVRMAGASYKSVVNHPLAAISWAIGTPKKYLPGITPKGQLDILGNQFDAADELTHFARSQARGASEWKDRVRTEYKQVTPFTDPNFVDAWSDQIFKFRHDDIAKRIASGEDYSTIKAWLKSDDQAARAYRDLEDLTLDNADGYVENLSNLIKANTYGNQTLLEAISTGRFNGKDIFITSDQGARTLNPAFKKKLTKLVDEDISPEHAIGDMIEPRTTKSVKDARDNVTERVFNTLLSRPSNFLSRSPTFRQAYWQNVEEGIMHASPDAQKAIIDAAREANMGKDVISSLTATSKKASGELSLDELDIYAKGHALKAEEKLLYDLTNRNQLLDAMRLVFPFGEAWKEVLGSWAKITAANPGVVPRAGMLVNGARSSGFFYEDPVSGEEKFVFPGTQFVNRSLLGIDAPFQAGASSLNMFSNNPLLPGFGPIPQVAVGRLFPDKPDNEFIRSMVLPYGEPGSPLPSWAQKAWAGFTESNTNKLYADSVADAARYLHSTGKYDMDNDADQQELEIEARKMGKRLLLFRALGQAVLPAAPSYQDVAKDDNGHTVLAFTLTDRYRQLLKEDDDNNTNDAAQRFISEFGEKNLLYMQSFSKGGEVFSKAGYDWVRENPEIVSRYPEIYGLIAPDDGGFDIKAYHALFENGTRKTLPVKEALKAANHRAGKMVLRNITEKMPPPSKRTQAQKLWLNDVKKKLVDKYPGYDPSYKGTDIPDRIARLSRAVEDPLLARQTVTAPIRTYLKARARVEALAAEKGIIGWQTAKKMKAQRQWLAEVADKLIREQPTFRNVYDDLFDHELSDEEGT